MKSIVVVYDKNRAIGAANKMLWVDELPEYRRRFRDLTRTSAVIMGRRTYEELGNIIAGRQNIIVTHKFMQIPGLTLARGLQEAYAAAEHLDTVVIGGANIFEQAMADVTRIYATEVHTTHPRGDVFFPMISRPQWQEIKREKFYADGANKYDFDFVIYERS